MNKVVFSSLLGLAVLSGCSDKPAGEQSVFSVTDFEYTMNNKQAVSISFGESKDDVCSATIYRQSVKSGFSVSTKQKSSKDVTFDCSWGGKYYVQSSKHPTSGSFKVLNLDSANKTANLSVSVNLVNPSTDSYLKLNNVSLSLNEEQFSNLVKKI